MKFLIIAMSPQFLRPFIPTIRELASRGHAVTVAWHVESRGGEAHLAELEGCPGVTCTTVSGKRSEHREEVTLIRRLWNYLRYLDRPYLGAAKLRRRAFVKVARAFFDARSEVRTEWSDAVTARLSPREVRRLLGLLSFVERQLSTDPLCDVFLEAHRPDAVLLTPLVDLNSSTQADYAQSARRMRIPVGMLAYSWDNLSTKGGLHVMPDRIFVWNNKQAREARDLHAVPGSAITVVGAPRFDAFLACRRGSKPKAFAAELGFDPASPIITYVCSSAFVSGNELPFVREWVRAVRSAPDPAVRGANIIVRPHPDIALTPPDEPAAKVTIGTNIVAGSVWRPFDDDRAIVLGTTQRTPDSLFEVLIHSAAVVGLNTSAEIEAALLSKPVLSILAGRDAADGQEDTLHFRYLLREEGGWVDKAATLSEHVAQLSAALTLSEEELGLRRVRALRFVRPLGRQKAVAPLLADAIEAAWASTPLSPPTSSAPLASATP